RVTRFIKAMTLQKPDRVPLVLPAGSFPLYYYGMTLKDAMHDNERACLAYRKFFDEFKGGDTAAGAGAMSARASEILDSLSSRWPGHGLPDDATMPQFVEGEYMKADEYDILIKDPADFCFRYYLPRTLGALKPFATFSPLSHMLGMPNRFVMPAVRPDVRAAFQAIIDYGEEVEAWQKPFGEFHRMTLAAGYPSLMGGQSHAPFDILADTLRGTRGIIMDMYRQPEKIMEAMEMLTPMNIDIGVQMADASRNPVVFFALHKGDDMFMSDAQFEKFYWPYLRRVVEGLVEEGCVPCLFAEGKYTNRLDLVTDLPRGKVYWHFDQTDMDKAKKVLRDRACIAGNVPTSLLLTGTPQAVKEYCRHLIEVCGEGGGFILTGGASIDKGNPDNLRAMIEAVEEYGVYS
ncbi:MAG: hypothetical protein MUO19_01685, partial [Dehalococcoidales bacterium]|nr:hypothetical protein [Dehalococcoidales bacterium]